ncbi:MAG: hypothetical protein AABX50_00850 [Nanoarchaeota archaeon]
MSKKCIYCKKDIHDESVMDVCVPCGVGVWGQKMYSTIVRKMENARDNDDLVSTNTIGIKDFGKRNF